MIRRSHAVQIGGLAIKLFLTEKDIEVLRKFVLWRDGYTCQECGAPATRAMRIVARREHGSDYADNLVAACEDCYQRSSDPEDDRVTFPIDTSKTPVRVQSRSEWRLSEEVIEFYRDFYQRNIPRKKVKRKINNLMQNNAALLKQSGSYRFFDVGQFILVAKDREVIKAITFADFENGKMEV
jgi:hypothetical protein